MTPQPRLPSLDSIKKSLVALRMPRALEMLHATFRGIEPGEIDGLEAVYNPVRRHSALGFKSPIQFEWTGQNVSLALSTKTGQVHLALSKDTPNCRPIQRNNGAIDTLPILGGLHHQYARI